MATNPIRTPRGLAVKEQHDPFPSKTFPVGVRESAPILVPTDAEQVRLIIPLTGLPVLSTVTKIDILRAQVFISYHDGTAWDLLIGCTSSGRGKQPDSKITISRKMKPENKFQRQIMIRFEAKTPMTLSASTVEFE